MQADKRAVRLNRSDLLSNPAHLTLILRSCLQYALQPHHLDDLSYSASTAKDAPIFDDSKPAVALE